MSPRSPVFLEVDEDEREPSVHRTRSNGYLDFLKDQAAWEEREREQQMIRYRDRHNFTPGHQRSTSSHLCVPIYERSPRRNRSHSDARSVDFEHEELQKLRSNDIRPIPKPVVNRDVSSEPLLSSQFVERGSHHSRSARHEKPKIKVQIVQDNPPVAPTKDRTPSKSPSASPRSATGQPRLQYKYLVLQNKLADIYLACSQYANVEAARPQDLTFAKIGELVKGFEFEMRVWSHTANVSSLPRADMPEDIKAITEAASRNLDRLTDRATELHRACSQAKPRDLKFDGLEKVEDENLFSDDNSDRSDADPTESLGYIINSSLHSIELQIQNLKRLSRSLQEATPDARYELEAVSSLAEEAEKYFGTENSLMRYSIETKYSGRRALQEARLAAAA